MTKEFENKTDPVPKFTDILIHIASKYITKTSTSSKRIKKPWFNEDCRQAIKSRKEAERLFNKTPTLVNLNNFRIARAKARRTINQSKRKSWKDNVSNLNMHTPINKVWNAIRKIKGKGTTEKYKHLKLGNQIITDKKEITNTIGQTISKNSSKDKMNPKFTAYKNAQEKKSLDFTSENKKNVIMNPLLSMMYYSL